MPVAVGPVSASAPVPAITPALAPALVRPLSIAIGALVACAALTPLTLPILFGVLMVLVFTNECLTGRLGVPDGLASSTVISGACLCLWALLGSLWALKPSAALSLPILILIYLLSAVSLTSWFRLLPHVDQVRMVRPMMFGGGIAIAFLVIELLTQGSITGLVAKAFSSLGVTMRGVSNDPAAWPEFSGAYYNRHVAASILMMPAALFAIRLLTRRPLRRQLIAGFMATIMFILALSASSTSALGFIGAAVIYPLARLWPQRLHAGLIVLFTAVLLLAVPLARVPFALGLHNAAWMPGTFQDRVVIWNWNAAATADHYVFGIGLQGTQIKLAQWIAEHGASANKMGADRPAWHPHNGYLEIWSELGLVGALLALWFGISLLLAIAKYSARTQPYMIGLAVAFLGIAATGWSLWQAWLMAALTIGLTFLNWVSLMEANDPRFRRAGPDRALAASVDNA